MNHATALDRSVLKLGVSDKGRSARRAAAFGDADDYDEDEEMDDDDYGDADHFLDEDEESGDRDAEMVGEFGEGGKIGIAALAALGYSVCIQTNGQKWEWFACAALLLSPSLLLTIHSPLCPRAGISAAGPSAAAMASASASRSPIWSFSSPKRTCRRSGKTVLSVRRTQSSQ